MKLILIAAVLMASIPALAQTKDAKPPSAPVGVTKQATPPPTLTTAEQIAIQACEKVKQEASKQFSEANQQELTVLRDFSAAHPGFTVNQQNFQVEAIPEPKK